MNRRLLLPIGSSLFAAGLVVAACGSPAASPAASAPVASGSAAASAAPSLVLPSIVIPSVSIPPIPSIAVPSIALPSSLPSIALPSIALPSNLPSFAIPSLPNGSAIPSFEIPSFSFPSEDKDLEGKLPNQINNVTLVKYSFKGTSFLESGASSTQDLIDLLAALGKTPNDMSVAFAGDPNGQLNVQLGAFRVVGADTNALLQGFIVATKKESPEDVVTQASVGGKNVTQLVDPTDTTSGVVYIYASGDTLFYVSTPDATLAATALQALP